MIQRWVRAGKTAFLKPSFLLACDLYTLRAGSTVLTVKKKVHVKRVPVAVKTQKAHLFFLLVFGLKV